MADRFEQLLHERGLLSEADAGELRGPELGTQLLREGRIDRPGLRSLLSEAWGLQTMDPQSPGDPAAIERFPRTLAESLRAVPFAIDEGTLLVAIEDPATLPRLDEMSFVIGMETRPHIVTPPDLSAMLHRHFDVAIPEAHLPLLSDGAEGEPDALEQTRRRLELAETRDDVVSALLDHAARGLRFCCLFINHKGNARGWDSRVSRGEWALPLDALRKVSIAFDAPTPLRSVFNSRTPYIGPLSADGEGADLLERLQRPPGAALVMPLFVRERLVGMLYGDNAGEEIDPQVLAELGLLMKSVAKAFADVIVRRKFEASGAHAIPAEPIGIPAQSEAPAEPLAEEVEVPAAPPEPTRRPPVGSPAQRAPEFSSDDVPNEMLPPPEVFDELAKAAGQSGGAALEVSFENLPPAAAEPEPAIEAEIGPAPIEATPAASFSGPEAVPERRRPAYFGEEWGRLPGEGFEGLEAVTLDDVVIPPPASELTLEGEGAEAEEIEIPILEAQDPAEVLTWLKSEDPAQWDRGASAIRSMGDEGVELLMEQFPGRTVISLDRQYDVLPPASEHGGVLRAVVSLGEDAALELRRCLRSRKWRERFYATWCFGEIEHPASVPHLMHLLVDPSPRVAMVAEQVLQSYRSERIFRHVVVLLQDFMEMDEPERRRLGARLLGRFAVSEAIPDLIRGLNDRDASVVEAAQEALRRVTLAQPGTRARDWERWWQQHSREPRERWLLRALKHEDEHLRLMAATELRALAGEDYGYFYLADEAARAPAVERWQQWAQQRS